ncbi:MAG: class I SAM-dependent methyltransferase [Pseudomonadota bacterium]
MADWNSSSFGELYADEYDALHDPGTTKDSVDLISSLAGDGTLFELAIGTGRMAIPLAKKGHVIQGLEASSEMVAKLREKPGGDAIHVQIADMSEFETRERYDFAFLVFNTLFNLTSQSAQIGCFASVADCLNPRGYFLVETFVPDIGRFRSGEDVSVSKLDTESVWLEAVVHNGVDQTLDFQRIRYSREGVKIAPLKMRYAWPAEIDLMAQLAGLRLKHRWGGWNRESFTDKSRMHVSLYEKMT